ncbi:MAG: hypothetical protein JWO77_2685 [Ilumatobacteraceae bacterium]|nr:hypothetical protein [Ilumatobacteraceae bacterium]
MTTPTADAPAPPPPPDAPDTSDAPGPAVAPVRPAAHGVVSATALIATLGVVVALIGLGLMLRTVSTPTQDCGTSIAFLLQGRVNVFVSVDDPPEGITKAEAEANNATPCRERVADQVKPAALLFGAGLVAAVGAAAVEMAVRGAGWLKRRRARRARTEAPPGP